MKNYILPIILMVLIIIVLIAIVFIFKNKKKTIDNTYPDEEKSVYTKNDIENVLPDQIDLNLNDKLNITTIDVLRYIGLNEKYNIGKEYYPSNIIKENIILNNNKNFIIGKILTNNNKIFIFIDDYDLTPIDNTFTMTNVNNKFNIITKFYEDYLKSNIKDRDFSNKTLFVYARGYSVAFIYLIYHLKQYNTDSIFMLEGFPSIISNMNDDFINNTSNVVCFNILKDPLITYVHKTEYDNKNNMIFFDYLNSKTAYGENFESKYDNHHILTYQKLFK